MSVDTTARMISKTDDSRLRRELTSLMNGYKSLAEDAKRGLRAHGLAPEDNKNMTKLMTNVGIAVNTMLDSTPSHIAEIMINGTNMGLIKMNKHLNRNKSCPSQTAEKSRKLMDFERDSNA